jgi:hypothetical protein
MGALTRNILSFRAFKSPTGLVALAAFTSAVCYGTWNWPLAASTRIGGNFQTIEKAEIVAGDREGRISPLCGCEAEFQQPLWHGFVFARTTAKVDFRDPGDAPYFLGISATEAKPITPFGYLHLAAFFHIKEGDGSTRIIGPTKVAGLSFLLEDQFEIAPTGDFPQ